MPSFPGGYPSASTVTGPDKLLIGQGGTVKETTVAEVTAAVTTVAEAAATAASAAQTDADAAMTEATAASAAAAAAQAAATAAATAAAAAQADADAAATAAAAAAAGSGATAAATALAAANAAATVAASANTAASGAATAAASANTTATSALTLATAAKAQAESAEDDAAAAAAAATAAQTAADTAQSGVDDLEATLAAIQESGLMGENVKISPDGTQEITSTTPTLITNMTIPLTGRRLYWFTLRYMVDRDGNDATLTIDSSATMDELIWQDPNAATSLSSGWDIRVVHGFAQAATSGELRFKIAMVGGTIFVHGRSVLTWRSWSIAPPA